MRCNFDLLGNINVIVKFTDVMHERRLAPHDDYHLSSFTLKKRMPMNKHCRY